MIALKCRRYLWHKAQLLKAGFLKLEVDKAERIYWASTRVGMNTWEGLDDDARCAFFPVLRASCYQSVDGPMTMGDGCSRRRLACLLNGCSKPAIFSDVKGSISEMVSLSWFEPHLLMLSLVFDFDCGVTTGKRRWKEMPGGAGKPCTSGSNSTFTAMALRRLLRRRVCASARDP